MAFKLKVGIIGGSGFYQMEELANKQEVQLDTEFGSPSDSLITGTISGIDCVVLARHGRKHHLNPTEVNFRANIRALQKLGVTHVLAATACGSLREDMAPGDLCILDSFVDRTTKRHQTFHDQASGPLGFGTVCHIPMSPSFCAETAAILSTTAQSLGFKCHNGGTMVTIEGPRFSSKAESLLFRSWKCDLINMTTVPEVVLAAEAGMAYSSVAMVTDYDCWKESEEAVNVEKVMAVLRQNISNVKALFVATIAKMKDYPSWEPVIESKRKQALNSVLGH